MRCRRGEIRGAIGNHLAELARIEVCVQSAACEQILGRPLLENLSGRQRENSVDASDQVEVVRDDQRRSALDQRA